MNTLPDFLESDLAIISIGLNPSLPSVRAGYYFANPRNRFWKALNNSHLVEEEIQPGIDAHRYLLQRYKLGFTDVVKRPSAGAKDLTREDYKQWAPILKDKLLQYSPEICWFHGKLALENFMRLAYPSIEVGNWGLQKFSIGTARVFMSPNPSPANAAFGLHELTHSYNRLARLVTVSNA